MTTLEQWYRMKNAGKLAYKRGIDHNDCTVVAAPDENIGFLSRSADAPT